jgi:hypothetical protein
VTDEVLFDPARARTYQPRDIAKRARIVPAAPGERTTIVAEWGAEEHFVGSWVAVLDERGETIYGAAYAEWVGMHERIPGTADSWRKVATVDAYRYDGPPGTVTTVLRDGTVETVNTVRSGDWMVRQRGGEVQVVRDEVFRARYHADHPVEDSAR